MTLSCIESIQPSSTQRSVFHAIVTTIAVALVVIGILGRYEVIKGMGISSIPLIAGGSVIGVLELYFLCKKSSIRDAVYKDTVYKVTTWNMGTNGDFIRLKKGTQETADQLRKPLVEKALSSEPFVSSDILFLQETFDATRNELAALLPKFSLQTDSNRQWADTVVAWRSDKFRVIESGVFLRKSAYVLLEDLQTHTTILAASAHIEGFNLETNRGFEVGDQDLAQIASEALRKSAGVTIIGMDANTTSNHHPERLQALTNNGFVLDPDGISTFNDLNLKVPVKLDHFAFHVRGRQIQQRPIGIPYNLQFDHPENPSDHSPIALQIVVTSMNVPKD